MSGSEFGPGGYLPPKASKRARKIVLREQMGFGWPLAAVAASLLVVVAGILFLRNATRPPGAPYAPAVALADVPAGEAAVVGEERSVLVVRAGGPVRAFVAEPEGLTWCPESRRLETDTAAWLPDGRHVYGDATSLQPLRSLVFDGVVYVDGQTDVPRPAPAPADQPPVCTGGD